MQSLFQPYQIIIEDIPCFVAGLPGYPRNFSRDTFIAGIIATDKNLITSQLNMSLQHQGAVADPLTGEEPGKIHHEYPGVIVNDPYVSTYNACDTTALHLIGLELLQHIDPAAYTSAQDSYAASIETALQYLHNHLLHDIFWEYPPQRARHFSLHTTYWKDSIVPTGNNKQEPNYPVAYAIVQFQVARGFLAASRLLGSADLAATADRIYRKAITTFITTKEFCVEQDETNRLEQPSSDELHALAYIPEVYKDLLPLTNMAERASSLITPVGFACTPKTISDRLPDTYHGYVVWIFEQALIHYGCLKFGLRDLADIAVTCAPYIDEGHELLSVSPSVKSIGNSHQLWSVAAKIYFSEESSLRQTNWL